MCDTDSVQVCVILTECTGVTLTLRMAVLQALGKVAKVLEIDNDGDLRVVVDGLRWLMSPVSCTLIHDPHRQSQEPSVKETQSHVSKIGNYSPLIEVPVLL